MVVSEKAFSLSPGETKSIFIDIFAKEEEIPDAYTGRIIIKDEKTGATKIINVIIEVKEKKPLFDVIVDVLSKEVSPGSKLRAKLRVLNLGDLENIDISLYYAIKDFEGKLISFKEENMRIKKELDIIKELRMPRDTPVGNYVLYLKVSYGNVSASATDTFKVTKKIEKFNFILIILIIILIILIYLLLKRKNKKR
jgi:uncharacterized membrane protein